MTKAQWDATLASFDAAYHAKDYGRALAMLQPVLQARSVPPEAWNRAALAWLALGRKDDALAVAKRASAAASRNAGFFNTLGLVHQAFNDWQAALRAYSRAAKLAPEVAVFSYNCGNMLNRLNRLPDAVAAFQEAIAKEPGFANAWNNLGFCFKRLGRHDEAIAAYDRAIALRPDYNEARFNLGTIKLTLGDFAAGWEGYELRWGLLGHPDLRDKHPETRWSGSEGAGESVLLWCEQGLGDNLQFIRFAPLVAARGARVVVQCPPSLARLFASVDGVAEVRTVPPAPGEIPFQVPLASLPGLFDWTPDHPVNAAPYLKVPSGISHPLPPHPPGLKVGLMWAGKAMPDPARTCPLLQLLPLLEVQGVTFFSLQAGEGKEQLEQVPPARRPIDLDPGDFADTADLLRQLDLVISVDTSLLHLAGGLGVPTWLMLPKLADWRWMLECEDSPWYPSVRVFRQTQQGRWVDVIERLCAELQNFASGRPNGASLSPEISAARASR